MAEDKVKIDQKFPVIEGQDFSGAIIDTLDDPMLILDKHFLIRSANTSFYRKFHLKKDAVEGKSLFAIDSQKWNIPELIEMMNDVFLKDSGLYGFEITHTFPTTGSKIMLLRGRTIKSNNSNKLVLLAIEDITDCTQSYINEKELLKRDLNAYQASKRELEEAVKRRTSQLEQKNVELESLFQNATMGIVVINPAGVIIRINPRAEKKFRYSKEEITGKNIKMLIPGIFSFNHNKQEEGKSANRTNTQIELLGIKKGGIEFPVEVSLSPYASSIGDFIIVFIVDITVRKQNEMTILKKTKELQRSHRVLKSKNASLEKMNKELETFTFVSSHDLQEPLRKIKNFVDMLVNREKALTKDGKYYLQRTYETANRMQILIEDLLAYSRTKNADRNFERSDLNKIVEEVLTEFKEVIEEKKVTVIKNNLCEVTIIPFQFRQLLHNLFSNSIKFSHQKRKLRIKIKSKIEADHESKPKGLVQDQKYCHISISDNGIGFDPQYKDRIFEVFQRLHSTEDYKGTGIGLAICKRIVENHNGFITATGKPDKGTSFDIYLPV